MKAGGASGYSIKGRGIEQAIHRLLSKHTTCIASYLLPTHQIECFSLVPFCRIIATTYVNDEKIHVLDTF